MIHMRKYNDFEAANVKLLVDKQIAFTVLQITETGMHKSILDATAPVRAYFKEHGVHDYANQLLGSEHKRMVNTFIFTEWNQYATKTSLYRPLTKKGDPRLWICKTKGVDFLHANDIFALIAHRSMLFAINLSTVNITDVCRSSIHSPLRDFVNEISLSKSSISDELLYLIKERMSDWLPAEIMADTGIGRTVESVLGIAMNPSKSPDYKGIELKSHREMSKVRNTLFTQSPDWNSSKMKSSKQIVARYGYVPVGYSHKTLHVTLTSGRPNQQNLGLLIQQQKGVLEADEFSPVELADGTYAKVDDVAVWQLETLHDRLLTKHRETFWIEVENKMMNGCEFFRCAEILHTKNPIPAQFDILLEQGLITVDFLLCRNSGGDTYGFKINAKARQLLFPESAVYNLR